MKQITYIGIERCDFIYHLASILSLQGTVLVVDNSMSHDLIDFISVDGSRGMREWRNIVFVADIDIAKSNTQSYEYVLVYAGMEFDETDLNQNDYLLIMPDYAKTSLDIISQIAPDILSDDKTMIILRDYCTKRFTQKSVAQHLGIHPKKIVGYITLDKADMSAYIALGYNHYSNIKSVSEDMYDALQYVSSIILGITDNDKAQKKVMQAAKKIK